MAERGSNLPFNEAENGFYQQAFLNYLKCGSVGRVVDHTPGLSFADLHRKLDSVGIIKTPPGVQMDLAERIFFFSDLLKRSEKYGRKIPIQTFYKQYTSPNMETSMATMSRLGRILINGFEEKVGRTKRHGVALVITPNNNDELVLVGNDIGIERLGYGKRYNDVSVPMGFSKSPDKEESRVSLARILQREMWPQMAARGELGVDSDIVDEIVGNGPKLLGEVQIVDVGVKTYHLRLPERLSSPELCTPLKLRNHRYMELNSLLDDDTDEFRAGIVEVAEMYKRGVNENIVYIDGPPQISYLNQKLLALSVAD